MPRESQRCGERGEGTERWGNPQLLVRVSRTRTALVCSVFLREARHLHGFRPERGHRHPQCVLDLPPRLQADTEGHAWYHSSMKQCLQQCVGHVVSIGARGRYGGHAGCVIHAALTLASDPCFVDERRDVAVATCAPHDRTRAHRCITSNVNVLLCTAAAAVVTTAPTHLVQAGWGSQEPVRLHTRGWSEQRRSAAAVGGAKTSTQRAAQRPTLTHLHDLDARLESLTEHDCADTRGHPRTRASTRQGHTRRANASRMWCGANPPPLPSTRLSTTKLGTLVEPPGAGTDEGPYPRSSAI